MKKKIINTHANELTLRLKYLRLEIRSLQHNFIYATDKQKELIRKEIDTLLLAIIYIKEYIKIGLVSFKELDIFLKKELEEENSL